MNSLRCILVASLIAVVLGHGVMISPLPLNNNPTTQQYCGVSQYPSAPTSAVTWYGGTQVVVKWELIAGDGGNSVDGYFKTTSGDPTSADSFDTKVFSGMPIGPTVGDTYTYAASIPKGVKCANNNGLCLFRMVTNTGWNSCTYVNVSDCVGCNTTSKLELPVCKKANTLNFCNDQSNDYVYIDADADPTIVANGAKQAFEFNLNDTLVFTNGNSTSCQRSYQKFICGLSLPPCPGSGSTTPISDACRANCEKVVQECGLTDFHQNLYVCSNYPLCPGESSASMVPVGLLAVVASFFLVALTF